MVVEDIMVNLVVYIQTQEEMEQHHQLHHLVKQQLLVVEEVIKMKVVLVIMVNVVSVEAAEEDPVREVEVGQILTQLMVMEVMRHHSQSFLLQLLHLEFPKMVGQQKRPHNKLVLLMDHLHPPLIDQHLLQ